MDIANLIIRVTNEGLDRATRELRRLQDQAAGAQSANERFGKSIADLNKLALVGFGALTAVVGGSIKTAIDFEKAMAGVAKTVDFATDNGLANMKKGIEDLTKVIPLAFEELAEIAAIGGQLGVAEDDILGFTETIAKMGVAFDMSADVAADSMAKIAGVFGIPIAEIGALGDSINAVSNSVAATASDVIEFMKRVGGTSGALKISADNASALGGAMVALGLTPEVAGTAFNTLGTTLARFNNLSKKEASGFKALGLDTVEFAELIQTDAVAAIHQLLGATKELGGTEALTALDNAFGAPGSKIQQVAEGLNIVDLALEQVAIDANGVSAAFGSMDAEFASVSGTTANKIQLVKNNIRLLAAGVGEAFLPAVNEMILALVPVIEKMTAWAQANPELIRQIVLVAGALTGSIIAIATISGAIGTAIGAFQGLSAIFGVIKVAMTLLSTTIGLPVLAFAALVAAGIAVYKNWDTIVYQAGVFYGKFESVFLGLPEPVKEAWADIVGVFSAGIENVKAVLQFLSEVFEGTFSSFSQIASGSLATTWASVKAAFSSIVVTIKAALQIAGAVFVAGWELIKNSVKTALAVIKAVVTGDFKAIPKIMGDGLSGAISIVGDMMGKIVDVIKNWGKRMYAIGADFIQGFINGIKSVGSSVVSAASNMVGNAIAAVKKRQDSASPSKVTTKLGGDFSQGMANGIKKGAKTVKSEAQKMAESAVKAVQDGVAGLKRELALFGNDSALAALDYDIKVGKFGAANTGELRSLTQTKEQLELSKKLADANKSVQDSIDGLIKQQALFGNNSSLASLMYDIEHTEKYKGVTQELTDKLIEQTRALEQLGMTAKATDAIRARFAQLEKDKESSSTNLQGMLSGIEEETPLGKIQADYEARLAIIEQYEQLHTDMIGVQTEARLAVEQSYQDAKRDLMLTQGEALFGDLAGLAKGFAGEQSGIYKALFLVEKGFAIAQSAIAIQTSIAKAMSVGFPANIPIIGQAVSQGMGIMSSIKGITAGFKQGGYTGNMSASQVAGVVHGQEYVFDAAATKRIGVDNLNAMRRGDSPKGVGDVNINVNVDAKGNTQVSGDNERMGRDMANGIKAVVMDVMRKEKRQGGMLYA